MTNLVSFNTFFFNIGSADCLTLEASKPLHVAYIKATEEQQQDLFNRAVLNYCLGAFKLKEGSEVDIKKVNAILALKRVERSKEQERVVNASKAKARYHLVTRGESTETEKEPVKNLRLSSEVKTTAKQFLALFDGDVHKAIKALKQVA